MAVFKANLPLVTVDKHCCSFLILIVNWQDSRLSITPILLINLSLTVRQPLVMFKVLGHENSKLNLRLARAPVESWMWN